MRTTTSRRIRFGRPLGQGLALLASGLALHLPAGTALAAPPATGIECTTGTSPNPIFTLEAQPGYIQLPDGNTMYMWGYAPGGGGFQYPGPVLCVNQGDTVTVILNNTLPEDVSIIFPGQENVLANGAPAQPEFNGPAGALSSLTNVAANSSGSVTYSFVASNPGTYLYESGTNPAKQVRMGLFGALLVRPTMGAGFFYNRADSEFTPTE
jgi:FtsP/CotA-like multicopper oxidase with cupredoxin domain